MSMGQMAKCVHSGYSHGGYVEHLSLTKVAQQSVTKILSVMIMNVFAPKAGAKREPGNTKVGSITVPLTSCFTGLEPAV